MDNFNTTIKTLLLLGLGSLILPSRIAASTGSVTGITDVILTFSPEGGGVPVVVRAQDPDGEGSAGLQVLDEIKLSESTSYVLGVSVIDAIGEQNLTAEILSKGTEYQFFFGYSLGLFESPSGDGNLDNSADPVAYGDLDSNGRPIGIITSWTSACVDGNVAGTFRVILKHQPGTKSASSSVETGDTDFDLTFNLAVEEDPAAPPCENEEEIIDKVTLTFSPVSGGTPVVAVASDPDGPGPLDLTVGEIRLDESTAYEMTIKVENTIEGEDITEEILAEAEDHLFLFGWSGSIFADPTGDGNLDNRQDPVNYNDTDINGLPLGLSTRWTTAASMGSGTLQLVLKHQPDGTKTVSSGLETGGTDLDLTWNIRTVITSSNDLQKRGLTLDLAPNPANSQLYWVLSDRSKLENNFSVEIYNQFGQLIRQTIAPMDNVIALDGLNTGVYYLTIRNGMDVYTRRFVKID